MIENSQPGEAYGVQIRTVRGWQARYGWFEKCDPEMYPGEEDPIDRATTSRQWLLDHSGLTPDNVRVVRRITQIEVVE